MSREIQELREVIRKLVPMLTGRGLVVTQRGSQAYVTADPVTKRPKSVNIPNVSENASPDFLRAIQGFIDHEVAHVLLTDWTYYGGGPTREQLMDPKVQAFQNTHNIVEDTMIEREIVKIFPGSLRNIHDLREHFIEKVTKPAVAGAKSDQERFRYLFVPLMRALAGHKEFEEYLEAAGLWKDPIIADFVKLLTPAFLKALRAAKTTKETLAVARELHAILYPPQPATPPPPPAPPKGKSEDKPDQKAGKGDGDGERDHSESEADDDAEASDAPVDPDEDEKGSKSSSKPDEDEDENDDDAEDGEDVGSLFDEDEDDKTDDATGASEADEEGRDDGVEENEDDASGAAGEDDGDGSDDSDDEESPAGEPAGEEDDSDDADKGDDAAPGNDADEEDDAAGQGDSASGAGSSDDVGEDGADEDDQRDSVTGAAPINNDDTGGHETEIGEADEDMSNDGAGGRGNGYAPIKFDFSDDEFEAVDISSAITVLISEEAIEAMDPSQYLVFTTECDEIEPLVPPKDMNDSWVTRLDDETRQMTGRMQKDIERMMASQSLVIRTPGQKAGKLHSPSLFRVSQGDPRVFAKREEHKGKDTAVTLLIDNSGSMRGSKMRTAMVAAYALAATLDRVKIPHEILGFTTGDHRKVPRSIQEAMQEDMMRSGIRYDRLEPLVMPIYKEFTDRLDATVKQRIAFAANAQSFLWGNIDGECVEIAGMRLLRRMEKRKVMIVLSDGQPAGSHKSGAHLSYTVEKMGKLGIDMVGIGIMDSSVSRYYPKHVVLNDVTRLPFEVMDELKRILA